MGEGDIKKIPRGKLLKKVKKKVKKSKTKSKSQKKSQEKKSHVHIFSTNLPLGKSYIFRVQHPPMNPDSVYRAILFD